jgi:hypothetical protein
MTFKNYYYGAKSHDQIMRYARKACDTLGHGAFNAALPLLLETAAAETQLGTFPDSTQNNGFGITQLDHIAIGDIKTRIRLRDKNRIRSAYTVDITTITANDIHSDPQWSFLFARLHYKLRPEEIPGSLIERAAYWKKFYNTVAGKGTESHYIQSAKAHLYQDEA